MITQQKAYENINNIFLQASEEAVIGGTNWYQEAHDFCRSLITRSGLYLAELVGALAVLSPNCSWETNKKCLVSLIETGEPFGNVYPDNVRKAKAILHGSMTVQEALFKKKRYGQKVRSFYDNILNPDNSTKVTVDTHAIRGAFDSTAVTEKQLRWVFETITGYETLQSAYRQVAEQQKVAPHTVQAVVWLAVKEALAKGGEA